MHDADDERAHELIEPQTTEVSIDPGLRGLVLAVPMLVGTVAVAMMMHVIPVLVRVRMSTSMVDLGARALHDAREIPESERDEHQRDGHLHREPDRRRNHHAEQDDGAADDQD